MQPGETLTPVVYCPPDDAPLLPVCYQPRVGPNCWQQDVGHAENFPSAFPLTSGYNVSFSSAPYPSPYPPCHRLTRSSTVSDRHTVPQAATSSVGHQIIAPDSRCQLSQPPPPATRLTSLTPDRRTNPPETNLSPPASTMYQHSSSPTSGSTRTQPLGPLIVDGARWSRTLVRHGLPVPNAEEGDSSDYGLSEDDADKR